MSSLASWRIRVFFHVFGEQDSFKISGHYACCSLGTFFTKVYIHICRSAAAGHRRRRYLVLIWGTWTRLLDAWGAKDRIPISGGCRRWCYTGWGGICVWSVWTWGLGEPLDGDATQVSSALVRVTSSCPRASTRSPPLWGRWAEPGLCTTPRCLQTYIILYIIYEYEYHIGKTGKTAFYPKFYAKNAF